MVEAAWRYLAEVSRREYGSRAGNRKGLTGRGEWLAHGLMLHPWFYELLPIITEANGKV
jgi:hypothetical protein